jgi:hypothetical protein
LKPLETYFEVSEPVTEYRNAGLKRQALEEDLAKATGGRYFSAAAAPEETIRELTDELVKRATEARKEDRKVEIKEIWDMPLLFALLLVFAALEWVIRRRSGLA